MNKIMLIACLVCASSIVYSQPNQCDLLNKGVDYFGQEKLDSAILIWQYVVENTPDTSVCYGRSYYNIPFVYTKLNQLDKAKEWDIKILNSTLKDSDEGDNLMAPYANYKYKACLNLSEIYKEEGNYDKSFEYLDLSEQKYPYQAFSATSFEKEAVAIAYDRYELWLLKDNKKEALFALLEKILDNDILFRMPNPSSFTNVNFYTSIINQAKPLIKDLYGLKKFKKKFKAAINQLSVQAVLIDQNKKNAKLATFTFDGRVFKIGSSNPEYTIEQFKDRLLNNKLFAVLDEK